jgi:sRNA-binding regulator protein Hfq
MTRSASSVRFLGYALLVATLAVPDAPLLGAQRATAESPAEDWPENTPEGSRVKLTLRDGSEVTGNVVVVKSDAVILRDLQTGRSGVKTPSGSARDGFMFHRTDIGAITVLSRATVVDGPRAESFEQLMVMVRPGERVTVTEASGTQVSGTVAGVSPTALSLRVDGALRMLREHEVSTVRARRQDSLANGAKWGLGVGAAVGMASCGTCHIGPGLMAAGIYGGIGAGIGVGLDALIRGSMVVYQQRGSARRIAIAPQFGTSHKGVSVSLGF